MPNEQQFHWAEGMKFVAEGIKGLFLLNGAAAISVMTFVGNTKSVSHFLVCSMIVFAIGALFGPISFAAAYLTQLQYGNGDQRRASGFHYLTYGSVVVSMLMFLAGIMLAASGLWSGTFGEAAGQ